MKTYRMDWKAPAILIVGILGGMGIIDRTKADSVSIVLGIIGIVYVFLVSQTYLILKERTLTFVGVLFFRSHIDIDTILEITDIHPLTHEVSRSVHVRYMDDDGYVKSLDLRKLVFPKKALGRLIRDLKERKPSIELNEYAQKLMELA